MERRKLPLQQLLQMQEFYVKIRKIINKNEDVCSLVYQDEVSIKIIDKFPNSEFKFEIDTPKFDNGKTYFKVNFFPASSSTTKGLTSIIDTEIIEKRLNNWIDRIRKYNEIKLLPDDDFIKKYEKEFYDNFEILDDDADIAPYELEKQIIINNYFVTVIKLLKENTEDNSELIREAEIIKDNIPVLTKKATVKSISSFFAKVRKKSLPLLMEILEIGKKELFKRGINFILDNYHHLLS